MKVGKCDGCNYWSKGWEECNQCGQSLDARKYLPEQGDILVERQD